MKKVIVIGGEYTGSGAVFEYLSGRPDVFTAFDGKESDVIQSVNGILSHFSLTYSGGFHPAVHENSYQQLSQTLLGQRRSSILGRLFMSDIASVDTKACKQYLDAIIAGNVYFRYNALAEERIPPLKVLTNVLRGRSLNSLSFRLRLPVDRNEFLIKTRKFFNNLVEHDFNKSRTKGSDPKLVVINQAGSYWCPRLTKDLTGCDYLIRVKRNPYDHYNELKKFKGMKTPQEYVTWIEATEKMESDSFGSDLDMDFDKFVTCHEREKSKLCNILGLPIDVSSKYNVEESKLNVGAYKNQLGFAELEFIRRNMPR